MPAEWRKQQLGTSSWAKVMLCSLPQYFLMAKHKSQSKTGREGDMEEGKILVLVSMLFTASLNQKTFKDLIYDYFMYPCFSLTVSSKISEVCGHTVQWKTQNLCLYKPILNQHVLGDFSVGYLPSICLIYPASIDLPSIFHKTNHCLATARPGDPSWLGPYL